MMQLLLELAPTLLCTIALDGPFAQRGGCCRKLRRLLFEPGMSLLDVEFPVPSLGDVDKGRDKAAARQRDAVDIEDPTTTRALILQGHRSRYAFEALADL